LNELAKEHTDILRAVVESLTPEHVSDPASVGPHTDVFALGLLLYRAVTGKPAFEAPSALGVSIRLSMGEASPIGAHGVDVPDELGELVMKMLTKAPEGRPPMDHVVEVLGKAPAGAGPWRESLRRIAESATRLEVHLPDHLQDADVDEDDDFSDPTDEVLHPSFDAAPGGDTSPWAMADEAPIAVPKTVVMEAPTAPPDRAALPSDPPAPLPPLPPMQPLRPASEPAPAEPPKKGGVPEWAIWTAIALGALALVVGTATFVILIAT